MSRHKSSSGAEKHPYMRLSFWRSESNKFWNTAMYSNKSKDYMNESVQRFIDRENRYATLEAVKK